MYQKDSRERILRDLPTHELGELFAKLLQFNGIQHSDRVTKARDVVLSLVFIPIPDESAEQYFGRTSDAAEKRLDRRMVIHSRDGCIIGSNALSRVETI